MLPTEIMLFDDHSSDATFELASSMKERARTLGIDFVVQQNPKNLGYIRNFEQAASACSGEVIFLCDQDDVWMPDKVATLLGYFEADQSLLMAYSDARLVDANGQPMHCSQSEALGVSHSELALLKSGRGFDALLVRNLVTGATAAFRRRLLQLALPFSSLWIHDEWLAVIAAAGDAILFCPRQLIDYRQHDGNQIGLERRRLRDKIGSMFRSRGDFYRRQVRRTENLKERLDARRFAVSDKNMEHLVDRLQHIRYRAELPPSRFARLSPALREWQSGRYHRYSNGLRALMRDLLESV
jgi:glycosyltransferase involved in cell wall biosynthesis